MIGGGLMDPESTTEAFRERYLRIVRETARPHLWPVQRERITHPAVDAGRAVAGDRRGAGRAVPKPRVASVTSRKACPLPDPLPQTGEGVNLPEADGESKNRSPLPSAGEG